MLGLDTAGFGFLASRHTVGVFGRLRATVLLLEDAEGSRLLLVAADLLAGSRWMSEALGAALGPELGLTVDRIWLCASHTHAGPGHVFGDRFYDCLAAKDNDFDAETAHMLVDRIAAATRSAAARLVPGRVGVGRSPAWGALWHRSFGAFLANFGEPSALAEVHALAQDFVRRSFLAEPPESLDITRATVDPHVQVIWVEQSGRPAGVIAVVHGTPSILPASAAVWSPDVTGFAARNVHRALHAQFGVDVPVGFGAGAMGDVNVVDPALPIDEFRARRAMVLPGQIPDQVVGLADRAANALAEAVLAAAAVAANAARDDVKIDARFSEVLVPRAQVGGRAMPAEHQVGNAQFGGSELNRPDETSPGRRVALVRGVLVRLLTGEGSDVRKTLGRRWKLPVRLSDPHSPKRYGVYRILRHTRWYFRRNGRAGQDLDPHLALRLVRLGPWTLAGVGVEPSVGLAPDLRAAVGVPDPASCIILGLVGGYVGYAVTDSEYRVQDYEGAATFWGRDTGALVAQELAALANNPRGTAPTGQARFNTDFRSGGPPVELALPGSTGPGSPDLTVRISRRDHQDLAPGGRAADQLVWEGRWMAAPSGRPVGPWGPGWVVRLERRVEVGWEPVRWGACDVDDAQVDLLVRRQVAPDDVHVLWSVQAWLPRNLLPADAVVRWRVADREDVRPVPGTESEARVWGDGTPA